ncbi:hypothetical protein ABIE26_000657 [Pedobacter africanus]
MGLKGKMFMLSLNLKIITKYWLLLLVLMVMVGGVNEVKGQRIYATTVTKIGTTTGVTITNETKAAASSPGTSPPSSTPPLANISATGTGGLTGSAVTGWIGLGFSSIPSNTIVYIKVSNITYLNTGGSITAQAYNNTTLATGSSFSVITAADGSIYYAVSATSTFNTVRLNVTGNGGLIPGAGTASTDVVYAFYNTTNTADCGLVLGTNGVNVSTPERAIDGSRTTFSTLTPGALLSSANQNFYFSSPSNTTDEVKMTISAPAAVLSVGLLNNVTVSAYNGSSTTAVWTAGLGNLLSADLLGLLSNATPITFSVAPGIAFDRVTINFGSVLNLFSNLYVHEIERTPQKPLFTPATLQNVTACPDVSTILAPDVPAAGNTFKWYDAATDGTLLSTGNSYTVNPIVNTTYYVATAKSGCSNESTRVPVTVTVNTINGGVIAANQTICSNSIPAAFTSTTAATVNAGGSAATYQWQKSTDNIAFTNINLATNETFTETVALTQTTYYRRVASSALNSINCSANSNVITIMLKPLPDLTSILTPSVCSGTNFSYAATSSLGSTSFSWTRALTSGISNPAGSGSSNQINEILVNTTQLPINVTYVFTLTSDGCPKSTNVIVKVNPKPQAPHIVSQ